MKKLIQGLKIAVPLWGILFLGGFLYGRSTSPDFTRRSNVEAYLSPRVAFTTTFVPGEQRPGSSGVTLKMGRMVMFACGPDTYVFDELRDASPRVIPTPHYTPSEDGPKTQSLNDAQIASVATLLGVTVRDAIQPLAKSTTPTRLVLLAGGVLGVGLGYHVGYRDALDCESDAVQSILGKDPELWKRLLARHPNAARLVPLNRAAGSPAVDASRPASP